MTKRKFVEQTAKKLLKQGRFATNGAGPRMTCRYKDDHGAKCAIGVWIPDELYDPTMEGFSVMSNKMAGVQAFLQKLVPSADLSFFTAVQSELHDSRARAGLALYSVDEALRWYDEGLV